MSVGPFTVMLSGMAIVLYCCDCCDCDCDCDDVDVCCGSNCKLPSSKLLIELSCVRRRRTLLLLLLLLFNPSRNNNNCLLLFSVDSNGNRPAYSTILNSNPTSCNNIVNRSLTNRNILLRASAPNTYDDTTLRNIIAMGWMVSTRRCGVG